MTLKNRTAMDHWHARLTLGSQGLEQLVSVPDCPLSEELKLFSSVKQNVPWRKLTNYMAVHTMELTQSERDYKTPFSKNLPKDYWFNERNLGRVVHFSTFFWPTCKPERGPTSPLPEFTDFLLVCTFVSHGRS